MMLLSVLPVIPAGIADSLNADDTLLMEVVNQISGQVPKRVFFFERILLNLILESLSKISRLLEVVKTSRPSFHTIVAYFDHKIDL
jgi:hypothetical protein